VDYDNLLSKLNKRLIEMGCSTDGQNCVLDDAGMGSMAMPMEQRTNLLNRIAETRQSLVQIMEEKDGQINDDTTGLSFSLQVPSIRIQKKRNNDTDSDAESGPRLYIRDDGTVDWEGALDDRDALRDFGISLWARINGQDPDSVSEESVEGGSEHAHGGNHNNNKAVTVKIEDTEEIRIQRNKLERLQKEYSVTEAEHLKLLNSAVPAGQAVANINLARINPELRSQIKQSTDKLEMKKEEVSFQNLIYELERIYTYFQREMESAGKGYIPLQDRLNVAEFGLLESQVKIFQTQLEAGEKVDEDVLKVVTDQVDNFKRRLAIDYYVTGFSFDKEAILEVTKDWAVQAKNGLLFYWKGTLLLFNDVVFASSLILRAVGGYTLKPREVRTLRRTFFDMLNFIPFVIILLIPLSPIGHVLVFQFIGKVYPDFFPSCFQESRQNLLQLYESTEYSEVTIQESLRDKLIRATQALFFFLTKPSRLLLGSSGDATTTTTTTTTPATTTTTPAKYAWSGTMAMLDMGYRCIPCDNMATKNGNNRHKQAPSIAIVHFTSLLTMS